MGRIETRPLNRDMWLRALHVKGAADGMLAAQMGKAEELLLSAARPRGTYKVMERAVVKTEGVSIEKHLEDCHQVIVMAATLGTDVDALIRKMQVSDMALAVIIDAGASVMIEQVCDDFEDDIKAQLAERTQDDIYFTARFSPGYGDYPLTEQGRILRYLDAPGKTGLHLTADSLLIPRKSVTALTGVAHHPVAGRMAACGECVLKEKCTLRKEGRFCGDKF